ncbi:alpha/beta fold hydrolase [Ilumatobacter sp.]|uniref:alpha/beta fold hydrolase n=1 Tax=Ilumatobacter sp. TaxID=1967498 RepID=UPI003B518ECE
MDGVPEVRFATARGARLAYQRFGRAEAPTVVASPPAAQNVEVGWEHPAIRAMLERFGSFADFVHFDKRGTGSSDRTVLVPGVDERVDDLRAVMDAAGVERAHLFAQSEGGPTTLLFAASYPDRVDGVILLGSSARMAPVGLSAEERQRSIGLRRHFADVWGTPDSLAVDMFAPSRSSDLEFRTWHQRYERLAASSDSLYDLLVQMIDMDVTDVLDDVEAPVLVLHRTGDVAMPVEWGREVAERVPDGRFVELEGEDHFGYLGDVESWMGEMERFVTGAAPRQTSPPRTGTGVYVRTLGRFSVEVDGEEVPTSAWGSRRARTLLKRLVVARGWPVTRDELTDLLWPDDPEPDRLGARLSVVLSAVRRVLGGGVVADRSTIALDPSRVRVDLVELFEARDDAAVVAAYAGELLPSERYEDWSAPARDEARQRFVEAARRRLAELPALAHGIDGRAALARRLLEADPWDDDTHRALVEALAAAGDVEGARRATDARRAALAELGIDEVDG